MTTAPGEQIRGIAIPLPAGERIRWTGTPDWSSLARHAFHVRKIMLYFALLLLWRAAGAIGQAEAVTYFLAGAIPLVVLGCFAIGCAFGLAYLTQRTSVYAITDRRVVMRIGIVIPQLFNIPFRQVESAGVRAFPDGSGDIALALAGSDRIAYFQLWPHARGWRIARPHPALRSVPNAAEVGAMLREAWQSVVDEAPAILSPAAGWHEPERAEAEPAGVT